MSAKTIAIVLGPLILLGAACLFLMVNWGAVPDSVPVHFGLNGQPDRWASRGAMLFLPAIIGAAVALPMALTGALHGTRGAGARTMLGAAWFVSALLSYMTIRPVLASGLNDGPVLFAAVIASTIVLIMVAIRETRRAGSPPPAEFWKLGLIYYNPNDPSVMVPKRWGMGWTLNFAHPLAWTFLLPVAVVPMVVWLIR